MNIYGKTNSKTAIFSRINHINVLVFHLKVRVWLTVNLLTENDYEP